MQLRPRFRCVPLALSAVALLAPAQTHRTAKADTVTRAVAVYEYTGDLAHPKAARLIPVSLFLGGHFEDAGVYLARPIPLALDTGNVYEFQRSGVRLGYLDLAFARNYNANAGGAAITNNYDDAWFGYGKYRALPTAKTPKALTARNNNARVVTDNADDRPKLVEKTGTAPQPLPRGADEDPDRPAKVSLPDDTSGGTKQDASAPDPERPTLHRQPGPPPGAASEPLDPKTGKPAKPPKVVVTATGDPSTDPDRPSIRRHTADENTVPPDPIDLASGKTAAAGTAADTVTGGPGIDNSYRPGLKRGRQTGTPGETLAAVTAPGAQDLTQVAAVSDAKDRSEHDFTFHFASDSDRAAVLKQMETLALQVLANPVLATDAPDILKKEAAAGKPVPLGAQAAGSAHAASPHASGAKTGSYTSTGKPASASRAGSHAAVSSSRPASSNAASAAGGSPLGLADEQLHAYQLTFSAEPTYVFTAHTGANTAPVRYATVVAQPDSDGKLQVAMRTTTDAAHLDRVPRFRLVDAVDADGSNRASLLFELRGAHSRQFALYRLLGAHPDQIFLSGSTL